VRFISVSRADLLQHTALSRANGSARAELSLIDELAVLTIGLRMVAAANMVEVAALVGDTARARMLAALMGGEALTATELAYCANVSRSTASGHLSKLVAARLLVVTRNRRFSYYRIASPLVARMLESIKLVAAFDLPPRHHPRSALDEAVRFARSCYDHLAGQAGVAITHHRICSRSDAGGCFRQQHSPIIPRH
jgi:DNA-binding transcriptional ArsR family regulator